MGDEESREPEIGERGRAVRRTREARLAEAMRQNLRRRKAQAKGRGGAAPAAAPAERGDGGSSPEG